PQVGAPGIGEGDAQTFAYWNHYVLKALQAADHGEMVGDFRGMRQNIIRQDQGHGSEFRQKQSQLVGGALSVGVEEHEVKGTGKRFDYFGACPPAQLTTL